MAEFNIIPSRSCLFIIDMTNAFLHPGAPLELPAGRSLIPELKKLIGICRDKGILILFCTHVFRKDGYDLGLQPVFSPGIDTLDILGEGAWGTEFYSEIQPQNHDIVIAKSRYSAFVGTELDLVLRNKEIDTLIIGGIASSVCCESTARDARMKDYKVIFLSDGTAARGSPDKGWGEITAEEVQRNVLTTMASHFAQVLSIEEVISRL